MKIKRAGFLVVVLGAFVAGASAGIEYAKKNYVSRDRKFIEGEISPKKADNR